ncbi:MAG TPA: hypothetical protein VN577_18915 [Terriglobales bacterium]|nr:hypothetical protein [Terriglobales bacterium]
MPTLARPIGRDPIAVCRFQRAVAAKNVTVARTLNAELRALTSSLRMEFAKKAQICAQIREQCETMRQQVRIFRFGKSAKYVM